MKTVLLVVALAAVALGRPDIGLTLRNKPISTSYGVPSASITNTPSGGYIPFSSTFEPPVYSTPAPFYTGSSTPISILPGDAGYSSFGGSVYTGSSTPISILPGDAGYSSFGSSVYTPQFSNGYFGGSLYQGLNSQLSSQQQSVYNTQQSSHQSHYSSSSSQAAEVNKHVYFYEAPEEPEEPKPHVSIPFAAPKKNVKILFIKAPHYAHPTYPTIPVLPQNEEKTIVYVLVKKPEEQGDIHIVTPPPTQPSKPEVYFIKYKNQKEAEDKVSTTLNEHSSSGANVITNFDGNGYPPANGGSSLDASNTVSSGDTGAIDTIVSSTPSPIDTVVSSTPGHETGAFGGGSFGGGSFVDGGFGIDGSSSFGSGFALGGQDYSSGVSILGNGLSGHYVTSTEPSFISSTGYDNSFGLGSSTVAPISIGNVAVHPTYGPPGESGPY